MSMAAPRTSMESEALSEPSLVVVTLAVLFHAEVGIRAADVTGVQTCALPISGARSTGPQDRTPAAMAQEGSVELSMDQLSPASVGRGSEIGRASCRERVEVATVVAKPKG